jgi:hypothetical protein
VERQARLPASQPSSELHGSGFGNVVVVLTEEEADCRAAGCSLADVVRGRRAGDGSFVLGVGFEKGWGEVAVRDGCCGG